MSATAAVGTEWWPSRYGADDQAGALNEIRPEKVVSAAHLVRRGRVYDLARVLHAAVPAFPGRTFTQTLDAPQAVPGPHGLGFVIERVHAPSQMGTWSPGPVPAEDPEQPFLVPQTLNTRFGIVVVENLYLSALAADGVREFLFVIGHPKVRGATGAWVAPLAIV